MHRSTVVFAVVTLLLAGAVMAVVWLIFWSSPGTVRSALDTSVAFGLPDLRPQDQDRVVKAKSAVVWNTEQDTILFEQNAFERGPIASITKLMTAMVALDYGINWDESSAIELEEYVIGGQLLLNPGETVTMRDLFTASLLGSANNATLAYVRVLDVDKKEFVRAMNRKAVELGLEQTYFTDVTGLDTGNVSTAYEVARMAEYAFSHYPDIASITQQREYSFIVGGSGREHIMRNTNKLISEGELTVTGSKTGYLYEAGYCLVVQGSEGRHDLITVVLDSPSEDDQYAAVNYLLDR